MQFEDIKNQIQAELDAKGLVAGYNLDSQGNGWGLVFTTVNLDAGSWANIKQHIVNEAASVIQHAVPGNWTWMLKQTFNANGQPYHGQFAFNILQAVK